MSSELKPTDKSGRRGVQVAKGTAIYFIESVTNIIYRLQTHEIRIRQRGGYFPDSFNFEGKYKKKPKAPPETRPGLPQRISGFTWHASFSILDDSRKC